MKYPQTVSASLDEKRGKFKLAEALAAEIPERKRGPHDRPVPELLTEARDEIIAGGGEPKSIETLADYRSTALWVFGPKTENYAWIEGATFTAHKRAMKAGLSLADFAALPPEKQTGDGAVEAAGRRPVRGTSTMSSWTDDQKVDAAKTLLADPKVAREVIDEVVEAAPIEVRRALNAAHEAEASAPTKAQTEIRSAGESPWEIVATARVLTDRVERLVQAASKVDLDDETREVLTESHRRLTAGVELFGTAIGSAINDHNIHEWMQGGVA